MLIFRQPKGSNFGNVCGYPHSQAQVCDLIVKPKPVRLDTGRNHMPIQIYLKIALRRKFSIQPDELNILCDVTDFLIDKA